MLDFMTRRKLVRFLDRSSKLAADLHPPKDGWISAVRHALNMPTDLIAQRKGVSRNAVYQAERSEKDGAISLKQMEKTAKAMGGRFVYAIVFDEEIETLRHRQSIARAQQLAREHPAFQTMTSDDRQDWIEDKAAELLHDMPSDFWEQTDAPSPD